MKQRPAADAGPGPNASEAPATAPSAATPANSETPADAAPAASSAPENRPRQRTRREPGNRNTAETVPDSQATAQPAENVGAEPAAAEPASPVSEAPKETATPETQERRQSDRSQDERPRREMTRNEARQLRENRLRAENPQAYEQRTAYERNRQQKPEGFERQERPRRDTFRDRRPPVTDESALNLSSDQEEEFVTAVPTELVAQPVAEFVPAPDSLPADAPASFTDAPVEADRQQPQPNQPAPPAPSRESIEYQNRVRRQYNQHIREFDGIIENEGVLEIMSDGGYGFLRFSLITTTSPVRMIFTFRLLKSNCSA